MNDTHKTVPNGSSRLPVKRMREEQDRLVAQRVRDVLWQTQARQMLAQERFLFATDGYLLTDLQGVVLEANYAAASLLETRQEFLLRKPLGVFLAEDSHAAYYERLARLATRTDVEQWETRVSRPYGQPRQIMLRAAAHADEHGIHLRWVLRDVTELREAQRQVLQAERLAAIGQMAAGMAHEGRNALQRIQACLSLLSLRLQKRPEELDLLGRIQKAQDDLQHLFEDVRSYAVAPRLRRHRHDLQQIWREAWNELADLPEWPTAELHEEIDGVDSHCQVDPFYLKHVFRNLLENALRCGANPVRVVVQCRLGSFSAEDAICLCLRDNGPGIPAEIRARLFQPFFTTKAHGTGLGLAISKRIVEAHGGQIAANGDCAAGAEIVITLPRRGT